MIRPATVTACARLSRGSIPGSRADTLFGLGSYVFTTDDEQATRVADQLGAGMVFVNLVGAYGVELPYGGVKPSFVVQTITRGQSPLCCRGSFRRRRSWRCQRRRPPSLPT